MRKKAEKKNSKWLDRLRIGIIAVGLVIIPLEIVL